MLPAHPLEINSTLFPSSQVLFPFAQWLSLDQSVKQPTEPWSKPRVRRHARGVVGGKARGVVGVKARGVVGGKAREWSGTLHVF